MPDTFSKKKRSEIMRQIKGKNTKFELFFLEKLEEKGIGPLECYCSELTGRPDFVHWQSKTAIFVDSCFWHGCKQHLRMPQSNRDYWVKKIKRNKKRDRKVTKQLQEEGWLVLRVWEHSTKKPKTLNWWLTRIGTLIRDRQS